MTTEINNLDWMDRQLIRAERKLNKIPKIGKTLSKIPVFISMIISFRKKEYTDIPWGTIVGLSFAILWFLSPIDLLPDIIPLLGFSDDTTIIMLASKRCNDDIEEYIAWRNKVNNVIELYD